MTPSSLLANLALKGLDHMLDRGGGFIACARCLDDKVVLAPNAEKGRVQAAVATVNPILRGWVNDSRVGTSSQAFNEVRYHVERKERRFAAGQRERTGYGWTRWSSGVVHASWGLFHDDRLVYASANPRTDHADVQPAR